MALALNNHEGWYAIKLQNQPITIRLQIKNKKRNHFFCLWIQRILKKIKSHSLSIFLVE